MIKLLKMDLHLICRQSTALSVLYYEICIYKTGVNYVPYVKEFIKKTSLNISRARGISFSQYDFEKSYVKYIQLVTAQK